ncbi:soluble NSF attachment protein [Phycomyces nitens]|nr:soluble NSF attachment protein [Phycomyces nitens]
MEAQRIRDGVKLMQEGDKASSKGLFRKPDWDVAAGCYERAATSFKIAKSYDQAVQAYAKTSEAFFKAGANHLAGKAMESAALILTQNLGQPQRAAEAYQQASDLFMTQGSIDRAAEQLEKAGRAMETTDINAAIEMYSAACALYEQEDRGRFAIDVFKKAISLLIKSKKYEKAIDMLQRQTVILQKMTSRSHLHKANLSILIIILAIGDEVEAGKQFHIMCSDSGFSQSEEADICQALLQAYEEGDQELMEQTVRRQHVSFLDNEVARLARTLTVPGEVLSSGLSGTSSVTSSKLYGSAIPSSHSTGRPAVTTQPQRPANGQNHSSSGGHIPPQPMSPAQVRAELYSRPPPRQQPQPQPQPQPQEMEKVNSKGLEKEFAELRVQPGPKPVAPASASASGPAPAPVAQTTEDDEDDEYDGLR